MHLVVIPNELKKIAAERIVSFYGKYDLKKLITTNFAILVIMRQNHNKNIIPIHVLKSICHHIRS